MDYKRWVYYKEDKKIVNNKEEYDQAITEGWTEYPWRAPFLTGNEGHPQDKRGPGRPAKGV